MALTRRFKGTVVARIERDPAFCEALLAEGVRCLLGGDVETGKSVLRDYDQRHRRFRRTRRVDSRSPKSLMRMFGPAGTPQAGNLFEVIGCLQAREGLQLRVRAQR